MSVAYLILAHDDPRLITQRRGGTLQDAHHRLLALWAAGCAEHVLCLFEQAQPEDERPRHAIEQARAWARGEITVTQARSAAVAAHAAAREAVGAAKEAARAAGHAVAVAHMADHELGAAAYAIRAVRAAAGPDERNDLGRAECLWQRSQLPVEIRDLVLDDEGCVTRNAGLSSTFNTFTSHSCLQRKFLTPCTSLIANLVSLGCST